MYTHSENCYKNSTGQHSNLLFLPNPSEHSWQSSPRSSQLCQASIYRQFLQIVFVHYDNKDRGTWASSEPQTL